MRARAIVAAVVVVAMMSGCMNYRQSRTVSIVSASIMLGGATLVAKVDGTVDDEVVLPIALLALLGLPLTIAGLLGMAIYTDEEARERTTRRAASAATVEAREFHHRAAETARSGDCTVAREHDSQIRALDAEFHATVFLRDVAIKRCLDAAVARDHLMKKARAAARTGDCAKVVSVSAEVLALDAEFHATVFLDDVANVAIKRCLDAAAPVTTPAPPVTPPEATP